MGLTSAKKYQQREAKDLAYYRDTYKHKSGWTSFVKGPDNGGTNYSLLSVDGGKTWYNRIVHVDDTVTLTPADPELLKSIHAWDVLADMANDRPVDLADPIQVNKLRDVGFTIDTVTVQPSK